MIASFQTTVVRPLSGLHGGGMNRITWESGPRNSVELITYKLSLLKHKVKLINPYPAKVENMVSF